MLQLIMLNKFAIKLLASLPYLFVFFASLSYSHDPDLGWHLKYGQHFINSGEVLRINIYSTMMSGYEWVNGGWLSDVLLFLIFQLSGFVGLTLVGALCVTSTFFVFSKSVMLSRNLQFLIFPLIIFLIQPIISTSLRGQHLSLLFFGFVIFLLTRLIKRKSNRIFSGIVGCILLVILFWSNLHQESFLGLATLGLWTGISIARKDKNTIKIFLAIFALSVIATFINPFGARTYEVALSHISDPLLKNVQEYLPFKTSTLNWWKLCIATLFSIVVFFFLVRRKRFEAIYIGITLLVLLALSFFIRRFAWPGFYLLIPFFGIAGSFYKENLFKKRIYIAIFFALAFLVVGLQKISMFGHGVENWTLYCAQLATPCSKKSADYIVDNLAEDKIYTFYDWGGFLIWNYPTIKPSIDGRMHLWRDKYGYSSTQEYIDIEKGKVSINNTRYSAVFIPKYRTGLYRELAKLVAQRKWKKVYEDKYSVIVVRN